MADEKKAVIGRRIKCARQSLDFTLKHIGDQIGVSPQAVRYIENNDDNALKRYLVFLRSQGADLNVIFNNNMIINE